MTSSPPILVSGLVNIETTVRVDGFPIPYFPVRYPFFGVRSTVSGVGVNISSALTTLGNTVRFLSLVGQDGAGWLAREKLRRSGVDDRYVLAQVAETAQSAILYDSDGRRQIHVDLKDIQEQVYPAALFEQAAAGCRLAVLCNINFSRPLLALARQRGMAVATDVHAIADLDDAYNADFMREADILFMSHEHLPMPPEDWAGAVSARYGNRIVVIGLGKDGALLAVSGEPPQRVPAVFTRPVVNTIGAGDALFSAFLHVYTQTNDPYLALRKAVLFASYKIGAAGAAEGFLNTAGLEAWIRKAHPAF
ncbi:MAG TPA: carbohydrate kinase family protein [Anaerolineae bacterium]|nr:carbohydrate kinase family protein [Anaerolineae bacterium]